MVDVRAFLASETKVLHDTIDARAARFDLTSERGLKDFLRFMWVGCSRVEKGLTYRGAQRLLPEWPSRCRSGLIARDLGEMDPPATQPVDFSGDAEVWGGLYVLEGSRLGGRFLARTTPLSAQSGFLTEGDTPDFWPVFLQRLRFAASDSGRRTGMAEGARKAFSAFLAA